MQSKETTLNNFFIYCIIKNSDIEMGYINNRKPESEDKNNDKFVLKSNEQ